MPTNPTNPTRKTNQTVSVHNEHPKLTSYKAFLAFLRLIGSEATSEEELLELYEHDITISLYGYTIGIPCDATAYNELTSLVETIIKEF